MKKKIKNTKAKTTTVAGFVKPLLPAMPSLKNFLLLGKFSDGTIKQVITNERMQRGISQCLIMLSSNGKLSVLDKNIEVLDWDSPIDLSGHGR